MLCPTCQAEIVTRVQTHRGDSYAETWVCPNGHRTPNGLVMRGPSVRALPPMPVASAPGKAAA